MGLRTSALAASDLAGPDLIAQHNVVLQLNELVLGVCFRAFIFFAAPTAYPGLIG